MHEQVFDLFFNLNATEEAVGLPNPLRFFEAGWMSTDWQQPTSDITPLLDAIIEHIPAPVIPEERRKCSFLHRLLELCNASPSVAYSAGQLRENMPISWSNAMALSPKPESRELHSLKGCRSKNESVSAGDICALVGLESRHR